MFKSYTDEFNAYLINSLNDYQVITNDLIEAMTYSLEAGGKRFRPVLMMLVANAINLDYRKVFDSGVAIEMIHTFSLIHDDLPCMDDDDLRRGLPTNHKVYGEAVALLAGDGLNNLAYEYIYKTIEKNQLGVDLGRAFSNSIMRMIEGQVLDMDESQKTLDDLINTHRNKTGALIEFCCIAPLLIAGSEDALVTRMREFAFHFGLSFQIKDDILDVEGSVANLGKSTSDVDNNKTTYVSLLGLNQAKAYLKQSIDQCKSILNELNLDTNELIMLCDYSINREK
jgi:geranylgeranyl diphosphate synthase type II